MRVRGYRGPSPYLSIVQYLATRDVHRNITHGNSVWHSNAGVMTMVAARIVAVKQSLAGENPAYHSVAALLGCEVNG